MPATERAFNEPLPARLYIDTNDLLDYFVTSSPNHARVERFIFRLGAHRVTMLYLSSISWLEFVNAIRRQNFRDALPVDWRQRYQLDRWQDLVVRRRYFAAWLGLLEDLISRFERNEVAVTPEVRTRAIGYVSTYNLKPQDAAHLACAHESGVVDLASFDEDFRRVGGLNLWNDKIYTYPVT